MGLEGVAGREYFGARVSPSPTFPLPRPQSITRQRRVQLSLNYAYGVLYGLVERACLLTGLDPCIGLLHTDNYNKPSLVFDLIELFRSHAERVVVNLFAARRIKAELFDQREGGFRLNADGRALLLDELNEYLDRPKLHGRRRLRIRDTIVYECQRLAGRLIKGLDSEPSIDLSVFDLAAEIARPAGTDRPDGSAADGEGSEVDLGDQKDSDADMGPL